VCELPENRARNEIQPLLSDLLVPFDDGNSAGEYMRICVSLAPGLSHTTVFWLSGFCPGQPG